MDRWKSIIRNKFNIQKIRKEKKIDGEDQRWRKEDVVTQKARKIPKYYISNLGVLEGRKGRSLKWRVRSQPAR